MEVGEDGAGQHHRHHGFRRLCAVCCVGLCSCFIFVVVVLGLAILIAWLALDRPKSTHYNIVSVSVQTLQVTGVTGNLLSNSQIDAEFVYGIEARNPNGRVSIEYEKFNVQTKYLGVDIGHTSVPGFRVGKKSSGTLSATTQGSVTASNIVGTALNNEIGQQSVTVQVNIDTRLRAHIGSYTSFWVWVHTDCVVNVTPPQGGRPGTLVTSKCHT